MIRLKFQDVVERINREIKHHAFLSLISHTLLRTFGIARHNGRIFELTAQLFHRRRLLRFVTLEGEDPFTYL